MLYSLDCLFFVKFIKSKKYSSIPILWINSWVKTLKHSSFLYIIILPKFWHPKQNPPFTFCAPNTLLSLSFKVLKNGVLKNVILKPSPISDELATFLGKEKGVEMARTDVTREINKYIRAHDLQDKENGRKINPDEPLRNLLKLTPESDIVLTYFNLQRYMGPHFPKSTKTVETAATSA